MAGQPVAMAALTNAGHNESTDDYGNPERFFGYITAWFLYQLKGDETADGAFTGSGPEIAANDNWSDVAISGIK